MGLGVVAMGLVAAATLLATRASPVPSEGFMEIGSSPAASVAKVERAWPRCPECGVIESVREIAPDRLYVVTVRFRDGTTTMFDAANPRTWRLGSPVSVIGGSGTPRS
jgi:hypothetical protein